MFPSFKKSGKKTLQVGLLALIFVLMLGARDALAFTGIPKMSVKIPTVKLTELISKEEGGATYLYVPWLAQYIVGVYEYSLGFAAIIAAVMIMVGGFQYLTGGGDASRVKAGQERIANAVIGLLLLFGSYGMLATIGPGLVSFDTLKIVQIKKQPFDTLKGVLEVYGTVAEEKEYDKQSVAAAANGEPGTQAESGQYRKTMLSTDTCGDGKGNSLGSTEEKIARLKKIISTWKSVGVDQGGAIYVRGGAINCVAPTELKQGYFLVAALIGPFRRGEITLTGECYDAIAEAAAPKADVTAIGNAHESNCAKAWSKQYSDLGAVKYGKAGMACGDCITFLMSLYGCFDKSLGPWTSAWNARTPGQCPSPSSKYVFVLGPNKADLTEDKITEAVAKLQIGDVLTWQQAGGGQGTNSGHHFLYTGGQNLGYEIIEMGGGGSADLPSGDSKAAKIAGVASATGMRAHTSAAKYLTNSARTFLSPLQSPRKGCLYAFRPIGN